MGLYDHIQQIRGNRTTHRRNGRIVYIQHPEYCPTSVELVDGWFKCLHCGEGSNRPVYTPTELQILGG